MDKLWGEGYVKTGENGTRNAFLRCWNFDYNNELSRLEIFTHKGDSGEIILNGRCTEKRVVTMREIKEAKWSGEAVTIRVAAGETITILFFGVRQGLASVLLDMLGFYNVPVLKSDGPTFKIKMSRTDSSKKQGLSGSYNLVVCHYGLFLQTTGGEMAAFWPAMYITKYDKAKTKFTFELGVGGPTGPGSWELKTTQGAEIVDEFEKIRTEHTLLQKRMDAHMATQLSSSFESPTTVPGDPVYQTIGSDRGALSIIGTDPRGSPLMVSGSPQMASGSQMMMASDSPRMARVSPLMTDRLRTQVEGSSYGTASLLGGVDASSDRTGTGSPDNHCSPLLIQRMCITEEEDKTV